MADSRLFKLGKEISIEEIGVGLESFFRNKKNLVAEGINTAEGYLVQAKQEESWKKFIGMDTAIQVQLYETGDMVTVNVGSGSWLDKAGAGAAGAIVFAPLAVTAAIGAWNQKRLPEEVFNYVENFIMTGGKNVSVSMDSGKGLAAETILCPSCHAVNDKGTKFCSSCGSGLSNTCSGCHANVPLNSKFCPECGMSMAPVTANCKGCNAELDKDAKFCPECGMSAQN
ncbi:zinc ribbon domain-containing protein [Listeria monocytogenes]|nr:zinc ribbon domain-containing protein [Listeria monocytogenes]EAC3732552.1 zinc ribbon domain-containing protein [Listeria monocytogenes]EAC5165202.1 zinc ribbon domain-containing protein [Listeria monocytogenes]EAC7371419.1 zinc ribbon domain-containing protein [Listeria monocytogenes]EAC9315344.1 zinc ribbon domain-containing protein [Listeria monocytogenes]